jgi:hypothetical protein
MWPPPAPSQGISHSQLPANLRPSSLPRPGDSERNEDDQSKCRGANPERLLDHPPHPKDTDDEELKTGTRAPRFENSDQIHERQTNEKGDAHSLSSKHSNQDNETRWENVVVKQKGVNTISDDNPDMRTVQSETAKTVSGDLRSDGSATFPSCAVDMVSSEGFVSSACAENSSYEEPMVIEFTRSDSANDDGNIPRLSNKRPRVNSESSISEVIKHSHLAKQRMTVFGTLLYGFTTNCNLFTHNVLNPKILLSGMCWNN